VCLGRAEKLCKETYGILCQNKDERANILLEVYKSMGMLDLQI
jgi:hypothetical protein